MKNLLIITTPNDLAIDLFKTEEIIEEYRVEVIEYDFNKQTFEENISKGLGDFDMVYLRDPFNSGENLEKVRKTLSLIFEIITLYPNIQVIDNLNSVDDIWLEDKWIQYQVFKSFMPETKLIDSFDSFVEGKHLLKERVSSRAKGIYFSVPENTELIQNQMLIQQELMEIQFEYRVMIVNDKVLPKVGIKRSKKKDNKLAITSGEDISTELEKYSLSVHRYAKEQGIDYNMVGLDVALQTNGEYKLIEYNRSPQFRAIYKLGGINPAIKLLIG